MKRKESRAGNTDELCQSLNIWLIIWHLLSAIPRPIHSFKSLMFISFLQEVTEGKDTLSGDDDSDQNSETPDGPDTSSFRAFLMSFVPSSTASKDSMETTTEHNLDMEYPTLTPVGKACSGRKGLLSRGKHSIGRIISKAGLGNLRQKQTHSIDGEIIGQTESIAPRFEMKGSKESTLHDKLPAMSEPSVLLTEMMRSILYTSLPVLVQGRKWMLVYRSEASLEHKYVADCYHLFCNIVSFLISVFTPFSAPGGMEYLCLLCIEEAGFALATHFWYFT